MLTDQFYDDEDAIETQEWLAAFQSLLEKAGPERAHYVLAKLTERARTQGINLSSLNTPYLNTIQSKDEQPLPGDPYIERRIRSLIRWNALAMVMRANQNDEDLGGHIATFASSATLYDIGFNYFFRAPHKDFLGDLIYYQGHSSPGIYARAFLEGRLSEQDLDRFRREVDGGLSSYPHPWLMPNFWQFPTVSMGLGPLQAIFQAHSMKFLQNRELLADQDRKIWAFLGDGEMDEPESLGAISLAGREKLDNLIFVVNCNLQRLDGPVRGNGKIIQELESVFRGAGWNVIKVVWGRLWDSLLAKDESGVLRKRMEETVDGEYQSYMTHGGAYTREHFFNRYPELAELVADLSDEDIHKLNRGGHDPFKVYAAYHQAVHHKGQPTVILAKTVKGYGLGPGGEALNKTHQVKKLDLDSLKAFRDRFDMAFTDEELKKIPYYRPAENSNEVRYLKEKRAALGGALPARNTQSEKLEIPPLSILNNLLEGSQGREISTTMGFVRWLSVLLKQEKIGERVVPIVPDEARTFGMESMFRQYGIYSSVGQLYEPEDVGQLMSYREDIKGRMLELGINEAGAFSAWMAAGTSYSVNQLPMIPFYIFYSMFGFQRIGDLAWAAGDSQVRGFLLGATAGRTTLNGEGLQHQDGHSHLLASTIPNCVAYDPTYNYELAVILREGLRRMYEAQENVFYYITLMNENYQHPAMPAGAEQGIIQGMYLLSEGDSQCDHRIHLLGSGTILREVEAAASMLKDIYDVHADVWSVTSYNELRKQALDVQHWNQLHPLEPKKQAYVSQCFQQKPFPIVAASDYMKIVAEQIAPFIENSFSALGTDGFGRSDTREKLRHHFEVDRYFIVVAALNALADQGVIGHSKVADAIKRFEINPEKINPLLA